MPKSRGRNRKKKVVQKNNTKEVYAPEHDINIPLMSKILYDIWPKEIFNTIQGVEDCKCFYNNAFKRIEIEINRILSQYHSAAWSREAYLQLEAWTLLWFKKQIKNFNINIKGTEGFIPAGRYGWRYILEVSLERAEATAIISTQRPTKKDLSDVLTLVSALAQCAEISNYLHYMAKDFSSVKIKFSPYLFFNSPSLNESEGLKFTKIRKLLDSSPDNEVYPDLVPDNNHVLMLKINTLLHDNFGFTIDDVNYFTKEVLVKIINSTRASVIVDSFENFVDLCLGLCTFSIQKIRSILSFILLDIKDEIYEPRNFLVKSQQKRMVNYCGAFIYLSNSLETIYTNEAAKFPYIRDEKIHIILAPMLMAEWVNNFIMRLVYGQREDLKLINSKVKSEISEVEEFFHKQIFEKGVTRLLETNEFKCINLKKINGKEIECGEIDILAYSENLRKLLIVEAKNLAPSKDAKAMGQVVSDHFRQKKYHKKFIKKIEWLKSNLNEVSKLFEARFGAGFSSEIEVKNYFVTRSGSVIKFLVSDYEVVSFTEFDFLLKNNYGKGR